MGQDLRKICNIREDVEGSSLREGHQFRFLDKLNQEFPTPKKTGKLHMLWKVAAMLTIGIGMGYLTFSILSDSAANIAKEASHISAKKKDFTIGSLSPALNKIETYYIANINLQLTTLKFSEENKDLLDGYMLRLDELAIAYKTLTLELNNEGPNEHTIAALIENLKLRLELLFELKNKLNELKNNTNGTI
ncbi:hypothetical protein [Flavicella sediminum]|uniref:hypothetical protein n=1 Tax=Flavicella sediminum TaxID=2585141 RepID=UPI001120FDB8|nr:hypothetical protein [Flavicella sediminum]